MTSRFNYVSSRPLISSDVVNARMYAKYTGLVADAAFWVRAGVGGVYWFRCTPCCESERRRFKLERRVVVCSRDVTGGGVLLCKWWGSWDVTSVL